MTGDSTEPEKAVTEMRLRPKPKPVLRLSRKVLIGAGAMCGIGLAGALAFSIAPRKPPLVQPSASDTQAPRNRPSTEALDALPKDYTGVPKLGPPLPGDLGRPMLAAQTGSTDMTYAAMPPPTYTPAAGTPTGQPDEAAQARTAARGSQLFFAQAASSAPVPEAVSTSVDPLAGLAAWSAPPPNGAPSEPDRKRAFLDREVDRQPVSEARLIKPVSPYLLQSGSVVPAALITGIRSDLPGQVLAQITQDIRDSLTGRYLLIPKGSRLIGQYDNAIAFGQSRLLLTWSRLILPNGKSLLLGRASAADTRGYAGLEDRTDYHWGGIVKAAAVSTLLSIGAQSGDTDADSALVRAMRDGASDSINRAGQRVVERQLNVQPTLTIRPGLPVRVILSRDLVLEPYGD
ncbi:TrbI/VirB10 family protein [Asticcacaulis sp.]|uniref:TrbI/VirB10 family protein n=1 Tax=Asticcacaulis sp. TaxID=1872648 RepID=UPI002CC2D4A0|nr:TrbI/VirB10 family protein [Asticcacaulis sp.]HTM82251.1 TrbI/VirB10 family protein [Asticcacaulis sp.]